MALPQKSATIPVRFPLWSAVIALVLSLLTPLKALPADIWTATGSLNTARRGHTATLLPNGQVLVAAGWGESNGPLNSAELCDPATRNWTLTAI